MTTMICFIADSGSWIKSSDDASRFAIHTRLTDPALSSRKQTDELSWTIFHLTDTSVTKSCFQSFDMNTSRFIYPVAKSYLSRYLLQCIGSYARRECAYPCIA